jgi:hypothetical protein
MITEQIKTFADACRVLNIPDEIPDMKSLTEKEQASIAAYYQLLIIVRALNEGWEADWRDSKQWKYWNWFYVDTEGFGDVYSFSAPSLAYSLTGARLCFRTHELALYASKQFKTLYFDYLYIRK